MFVFLVWVSCTVLCQKIISADKTETPDLHFIVNPQSVDVISGKNTTLQCEISNHRNVKLLWLLNGIPLANTTRRYTRQNGAMSTLHILRADRELDAGSFTCFATHDSHSHLNVTSPDAQLNILWIGAASVQLQSPESASYIKPNEEIILRCHLDGVGDIKITWFRNMEAVVENQYINFNKRRLVIQKVYPVHNGIYKCKAENEAGSVMSTNDFLLAVPGNRTALIDVIPKDQIAIVGDITQFDCSYKNADIVQWYFKKDGPLENTSHHSVLSNGSLVIKGVEQFDEGVYSCTGMRDDSTEIPQTYSAVLKLAFLDELTNASFEPRIIRHDKKNIVAVAEGGDFQLTCLAPVGLPTPRVWWRSPHNHTISDSGRIRVDSTRLIITEAKIESDNGFYTCVAENKVGVRELSFQFVATKQPILTEHPKSVDLNEGEPAELNCEFAGTEIPPAVTTIRWRRNGKLVSEDGNRIRVFPYNGTLIFISVRGSDQGQYKCEIRTEGHPPVFSNVATISVLEKLKFSPPPVNKKLELGSVGKIHCKLQGGTTGNPTVRWMKFNIKNLELEELPNHIDDVNGTLLFNSVKTGDVGTYICIGKDMDESINTTIRVDVVVAPKFNLEPKNLTEAVEGNPIMIHCVVEGDPKPSIQWDKNLRMNDFDHSRFKVLENNTLFISEVHMEDENNYGCTAGNSAGLNRKETKLIVKPGDGYRSDIENGENDGAMITKAVFITTSVAAAYMILVVGLMLWCRFKRRSRKLPLDAEEAKNETDETKDQTDDKTGADTTTAGIEGPSDPIKKPVLNNGEAHKSDSADTAYSQSSGHSKKSKSSYDKLQISRDGLKDIVTIGRGEFGEIMIAKLTSGKCASLSEHSSETELVMVKSLIETKDENILAELKRQIDMFSKKTHENVAKLIGLSREVEPHYMILEYTDWGDLKKFIIATRKEKNQEKNTPQPLNVLQMITIVLQIAQGAEHLADQRLVHKDIAARNCLITSQLKAKLTYAALTKDVYREEYCKHINQVIPLRWLPYEAVYDDDYSTKSDVYSWATLVWELFHQGEIPFSDLSDSVVLTQLKEEKLKWKIHKNVPTELGELQEKCWQQNPGERPTFTTIVQQMKSILSSL